MRLLVIVMGMVLLGGFVQAGNLGKNEHVIRVISERVADGIIEGLRTKEYGRYSYNFHPSLRDKIPPEHFKKSAADLKTRIGDYLYRDYMGYVTKGETTMVLWKARFSKSKDDLLIILTLSQEGSIQFVRDIKFNKP